MISPYMPQKGARGQTCCNCKPYGYYGDPRGPQDTWFKCACECHNYGGKYPEAKQKRYEKKHPEENPKVKNFPQWFKEEGERKRKQRKENLEDSGRV